MFGFVGVSVGDAVSLFTDGVGWLVDRSVHLLQDLFSCDYGGSPTCAFRPDDAAEQLASTIVFWLVAAYATVFFARVWGIGVPLTMAIPAAYVWTACRAMMHVYGLRFGCLVKLVFPVCIWDDLFDAASRTLMAPHIGWPEGLIPRTVCDRDADCVAETLAAADERTIALLSAGYTLDAERTTLVLNSVPRVGKKLVQEPTDCAADPMRFTGGAQSLFWAMEYALPGWQEYVPLSAFGPTARSAAYYYATQNATDPKFVACGVATLPSAFPLAAAAPVIAGFAIGLVHGVTLFALYSVGCVGKIVEYFKWRIAELEEERDEST